MLGLFNIKKYFNFEDNRLIARCDWGLSNRIKIILSVLTLSEIVKKKILIKWMVNNQCGARFDELFDNPEINDLITDQEIDDSFLVYKLRKKDNLEKELDILKAPFNKKIFFFSCTWYFESTEFIENAKYLSMTKNKFNLLKPIKYIRDEISSFRDKNFKSKIMGIHIRRGDFISKYGDNIFNLDLLKEKMNNFLAKFSDGKFFISTDDGAPEPENIKETVKINLIDKLMSIFGPDRIMYYPARSLNRRDNVSIQDALINIFLLREVDEFVGTKNSSFSQMCILNRNIPKTFI